MKHLSVADVWALEQGGALVVPPPEHVEACVRCQQTLADVEQARRVLSLAASTTPAVRWGAVDDVVDQLVEREAAKQLRWAKWRPAALALAALLVAAVVGAAVLGWRAASPPSGATLLVADGVDVASSPGVAGAAVDDGSELATGPSGAATLALPDASRAIVAAESRLTVVHAAKADVALALARGRVDVQASHAPRDRFVVQAGRFEVRVVGTVFSVKRDGDVVEVQVTEGRVAVSDGGAAPKFVSAGETERFGVVAPAAAVNPPQVLNAPVAAAGGAVKPATPAKVAVQREPPVLVVPAPMPVAQPPAPVAAPVAAPTPASPPPAAAGAPPVAAAPADEWATLPAVGAGQTQVVVEAPPGAANGPGLDGARDVEAIFLQRAQADVAAGKCEARLLGLEEIAQDAEKSPRSELARVLRARCFEALLRPRPAMREYDKYVQEYPAGRFRDEALKALGR